MAKLTMGGHKMVCDDLYQESQYSFSSLLATVVKHCV